MPAGERRSSRRAVSRRHRNPLWVPVTAATGAILIVIGLVLYFGGGDGGTATRVEQSVGADAPDSATSAPPGPASASGTPRASASPAAVSGCVSGKSIPAGSSQQSVRIGTDTRVYQLAVPAADARTRSLPLIFVFHAFGENAAAVEGYAHLAELGAKSGYAVVRPDGVGGRWNFVRRAAAGPDDVAFVAAIVNDLTARMCLDARRVSATGLGDGADMAVTAACALPGVFAAVVPVASAVMPDSCSGPPPSLLAVNGTSDPVTPLEGGGVDRPAPFDGTQAQPLQGRLDRYAGFMGCGPPGPWVWDTSSIRRLVYTACPGGRDVGLLAVQGGGHVWPDPDAIPPKGAARAQFSATQVVLAYFRGHPLPASVTGAPNPTG
ncbi:alpha/beta hydrolase family esterase [Protofrankia symbiont of Coriaria ruscifolia]|uniref:Poly(3-hydroxybutyrate) depolymerase-like protein n=1 Tax=Candidatus Protofrankia californiensis TaxID=1839754 RepID=A0A1C3PCP9_9ACTN|nr:PHB depolymerase family esterase [Protofrankia symbiont of Coriaria ruscifolia]SBW27603.1 poly(3-hydroxybutyrate) depolymerase-like protein [Candidatus Protofrankia californiensis]